MTEQDIAPEEQVNIEQIMQQIRQQIIAKRAALSPDGKPDIIVTGKRLPPAFYEHLYQARLAQDSFDVPVLVSKSSTPIIGPLIERLRAKFHELVVFYVNQSAARQVNATSHLIQALSALGRELEEETEDAPK